MRGGSGTMSICSRPIGRVLATALLLVALSTAANAQGRGFPASFGAADLARLRVLEGVWVGSAPGQSPLYQVYRFANDSTVEITYYRDSAMSRAMGTGRIYLAGGRIYHTYGSRRWGAMRLDDAGVFFAPDGNARSTFAWAFTNRDTWTSTLRSGSSGRETVTVYSMRRIR